MLIFDIRADHCAFIGSAWEIMERTGNKIQCKPYLKGGPIDSNLPIISVMTVVEVPQE